LFPSLDRRTYREPFLGGGAMFFHLRPRRAVLSDALADLITAYEVVRDAPDELLARLGELAIAHTHDHFYEVRERFNAGRHRPRTGARATGRAAPPAARTERAAWLLYLNRTCYNGLFRTNQAGEFNVPLGRYREPRIADAGRILAASRALAGPPAADLRRASFEVALRDAERGDFVYLDPPYVPLSPTSSFSAYSDGAFGPDDQARLAQCFRELDARGCLLALSNSDTPAVRALYRGFEITKVDAPRSISARGSARGSAPEVLVRNRACVLRARGG
jgi:DNA adenine methylase